MCGIAGVLKWRGGGTREFDVSRMTKVVAHRGPDGEGHLAFDLVSGGVDRGVGDDFVQPKPGDRFVYLGHRRLAILDLSPAGAQPMSAFGDALFITYNGEIYNYIELRAELVAKGHEFHTGTDTEVILHAYREWGTACFSRFNGMWALAILDVRARRLVLCVDRFGVKPLHFVVGAGFISFGSEIKQLLPHLDAVSANETAVAEFLATGVTHHDSQTCFDGVRRMTPGQLLVIDVDSAACIEQDWYALPFNPEYGSTDASAFSDAARRFRELFVSAVTLRLRSDVPVGSCLSGGLDSSAVVGVASREARAKGAGAFHTFTSCWEDPSIDEWHYAEAVVRANGCTSHRTFPTWSKFQADLDRLIWHQEEPFGNASMFAQWAVMGLAREQGVSVLLDGQGSDEMLGGYEGDVPLHLRDAILSSPLRGLRRAVSMRGNGYRVGVQGVVRSVFPAAMNAVYALRVFREGGDLRKARFVERGLANSLVAEYTRGNLQTLLRYEDRNSMAFSIESRCPFMDYRLAEFAFSLPRSMLSHDSVLKPLIRTALAEFLPAEVAGRLRKLGFAAPSFSIEGPGEIDVGSTIEWRRRMVARWRRTFKLAPAA